MTYLKDFWVLSHFEWYQNTEFGYMPTDLTPPEAVEALKAINAYSLRKYGRPKKLLRTYPELSYRVKIKGRSITHYHDTRELVFWADQGLLTPSTMVAKEGSDQWEKAGDAQELGFLFDYLSKCTLPDSYH